MPVGLSAKLEWPTASPVHIVQKFLSIRQRIHSKRLRILNSWWSDLWIDVTFTSQFCSILPHPCDDHLRSRFFISRITEPDRTKTKLSIFKRSKKSGREFFFFKILLFLHWPRRKGFVSQNFISAVARGLF